MATPQMTPEVMVNLALTNPELLASLLAAKGAHPSQLQGGIGTEQLMGGGQAMMPGPTTGPAATTLVGGAPPGAPSVPQLQALQGGGMPQIPLGDILAGVQTPQASQRPYPGAVGPQQGSIPPMNLLALMQWMAQGGGGGGGAGATVVPPTLGQIMR